ncbi:HigA family addiction module antitoxin [Granulicella tundricola]|uniref:Plasmid maintenance system antidote protein, XRE family n=1 Tax=Granulicella tundricola (strain ATCC BAA-1859 / DSM 23138 / MP5ACTX9) TaxID=1198114 RepID=E8X0K8_GRATM|nr:HigA family addiction module antitoxin [Granulicella tundricola]ADW68959.1 plasmid maintenance system antidote protein, XRE family [Granulicella tundricola MP5ACTX9]
MAMTRMHNPPHPGTVLKSYLEGHTIGSVAAHLGVSRVTLTRILGGHSAITAEMSIRLGEALKTSGEFWFTMQNNYDFWVASQVKRKKVTPLREAA